MSLIDNGNDGTSSSNDGDRDWSLLEFEAPARRYCTFSGCEAWADTGKELCVKHGARLVTSVVRNVEAKLVTTKAIAQGMAIANVQIADADARMLREAQVSSAQAYADEEADAEAAMEAELEAEIAQSAPTVETWGPFWFNGSRGDAEVFARLDARGLIAVTPGTNRADVIYKATPGAKVYTVNPGKLRPRNGAQPVTRPIEGTPAVPVAAAKAAPAAKVKAPIAAPVTPPALVRPAPQPPLVQAPIVTPEAAPLVGNGSTESLVRDLDAIASAPRPPEGLVNGYILPEDVNPFAGYYEDVIAVEGQPTRYRDARLHAAAMEGGAARVREVKAQLGMTVRAPQVTMRANETPIAADVSPVLAAGIMASRARRANAAATAVQAHLAEAPRVLKKEITASNVVIGARAEGAGILVGWDGLGEKTRDAGPLAWLATAGLPLTWAPEAKSAKAQLGQAVLVLKGAGTEISAERGALAGSAARDWTARWTVGHVNHRGTAGDAYGEIAVTFTLRGDQLSYEGDAAMAQKVLTEYNRRIGQETYNAGQITAWLQSVLKERLHAIRLGGNWYVRREYAAQAEALLDAASKNWGCSWMPTKPALPLATCEQLQRGLASALIEEGAKVLADLTKARVEAGPGKVISPGRAAGFLTRLTTVAERLKGFAETIGETQVARVRAMVTTAIEQVEPLCDDASKRGALIWEELGLGESGTSDE